MDQTLGGIAGDWGPELWSDASATVQPNGSQVTANSILTQSTVAEGQDRWTGWLQGLGTSAMQLVLADKAKANGLTPAVAPNGQPTYVATTPARSSALPGGLTPAGIAVIGGAALVGLLVVLAGRKG